jgi:hypothetical protein
MVLRIEQSKGGRDRYAMLSPQLLGRTQAAQPARVSAFVADPDGRILIRTSSSVRSKVVDLEAFRQVVERAVPSIGSIATGTRQRAIPVRAPVIRDGAVKAVVDNDGRIVARTHGDATAFR